jgi:hydroxymethylglutaryl-CoA lyase
MTGTHFTLEPRAAVRDVTLRDGLQLTGKILGVPEKVALIRKLLALGIRDLEIGSMARPELVPPLANTVEVLEALTAEELERCWVWVATPGHVAKAAAAGATRFQYCLSASESHNQANVARSVDTSLELLPAAIDAARQVGGLVQLAIATAFTCPFEGSVDAERVVAIATDQRAAEVTDVVICDTLGQAVPAQVTAVISLALQELNGPRVAFHGHDTWGLGVANSLAAIQAGASFVDGTLGGLGGCPFAPGASGNTSIEDLLFALRPDWLSPERFHRLLGLSVSLLDELEEPNRSKAVQGAQSTSSPFKWAERGLPVG